MLELLFRIAIVLGAAGVWLAGLRLFRQSDLSRTRKAAWAAILVLVGIGIGVLLPLGQVPGLGLADVLLLRSGRGLSFWIRACGFEVCTVFGAAAAARFLLDLAGAAALVPAVD